MTIVRIFDTAVNPEDVERGKELFRSQVQPAFDRLPGCHGIEMFVVVEEQSGGMVEVAALSRWDDLAAIEQAISTQEYEVALRELRELFEKTPIVRHFETID